MFTDTLHDFLTVAWNSRYILLFIAFLTATGLGLVWRAERDRARGRVAVLDEQLTIADQHPTYLRGRIAAAGRSDVLDDEDPVFSEGYVYDRIPAWVPADVPGSPQEPRRVPR